MPGNREKGKYWKSRKGKGFKGTPSWKISNQQQRNFIHEMGQVRSDAQSERGSEDFTLGQAKNTSSSVCETPMPTNSISNSNDLASASKRKLDSHQAEESQTPKTSRRKVTRMKVIQIKPNKVSKTNSKVIMIMKVQMICQICLDTDLLI